MLRQATGDRRPEYTGAIAHEGGEATGLERWPALRPTT